MGGAGARTARHSDRNAHGTHLRLRLEEALWGRTLLRSRNSASSRVKISFVTHAMLYSSRNRMQSWRTSAVFPLPTGPPIPTVKLRWSSDRAKGRSRSPNSPVATIAGTATGSEVPRDQRGKNK